MRTPFELNLERELDIEWQRFSNAWLFPWHNINIDGRTVVVEDYPGGHIRVGGLRFEGQIQEMYWQSIGRYLYQKIHETFQSWEAASASYPAKVKASSLEGIVLVLRRFVARIIKRAAETDRALRGRGNPQSVDPYNSSGIHSAANTQIIRLSDSYLALIPQPEPTQTKKRNLRGRFEDWYAENKATAWAIGIAIGIIVTGMKAFLF